MTAPDRSVRARSVHAATALPLVLLLWSAGLLAAMQFAKIAVPFAEVRVLYPLGEGRHGWLLSLVSLVGAVLGIVAGSLVGRIGARRMLIGGLVSGGLVSLWQGTGLGFGSMLASRVVEGASHLAIVVSAPTLIVSVTPERWRGAAMALWSTFFGIGFALLALLAPLLVGAGGPGTLFVAHGASMLLVAVPLSIVLRGMAGSPLPTAAPTTDRAAATDKRRAPASPLHAHARAYSSPFIAAPAVGWLFYTLTFVASLAILPDLLPAGTDRAVATAMPLVSIAVSLLAVPMLLRWRSATGVVMLGFALAACVLTAGALALSTVGLGLAVVSVSLFAALGLVQGASFAAVPELNTDPASQALAYGAMAQTGNVGNLLGTPLLLALLPYGGVVTVFAVVITLYVTAIVAHARLGARRRQARREL